jgi:hypothetical protein
MRDTQLFDLRQDDADVRAYQDASLAERLQHERDAPGVVGITDSAAAIWLAACGGLTFVAFAFAGIVYWTAGGC